MKISPKILKYVGLFLIVASAIMWPVSQFTFAKQEPPTVLALSWGAMILSGLAFFAASQDGEDTDIIRENVDKIMSHLGIEEE